METRIGRRKGRREEGRRGEMVIWLVIQTEADMQDGLHKANNQAIYPIQAVIRVLRK